MSDMSAAVCDIPLSTGPLVANSNAHRAQGLTRQRILDWTERLIVLCLYVYFVHRLVVSLEGSAWLGSGLLLLSEGLVIVLFLIRRPAAAVSARRSDWLLAMAGITLPLWASPSASGSLVPPLAGLLLMVMGLLVQVHSKLSLGRSMGVVAADRGIKRSGPYQFVRHPMYLGYFVTHIGFWLLHPSGWNFSVYVCGLAVQVLRLLAEERFLAASADYRSYTEEVRYRLVPGLF